MEDETIAQHRNAGPIEEKRGDFGRAALQEIDRFAEQKIGEGDREEKEVKRKGRVAHGLLTEEKGKAGHPQEKERKDIERKLVEGAPVGAGKESHRGGEETGEEKCQGCAYV